MKAIYFSWYDGPTEFLVLEESPPRLYRWYEETVGADTRVFYGDQMPWEVEAGIPPKRVLETDINEWGQL